MATTREAEQALAQQNLMNTLQSYFDDNGNCAFGPADFTVGTPNLATVRFNRLISFQFDGQGYGTKVPSTVTPPSTIANLVTGSHQKLLLINGGGGQLGTLTLVAGVASAVSLADAEYPARPTGTQVLATMSISNASGADFDYGVTSLVATGITARFGNATSPDAWLTPFNRTDD